MLIQPSAGFAITFTMATKKRHAEPSSGDENAVPKKAKVSSTADKGKGKGKKEPSAEDRQVNIKKSLNKNPENVFIIGPPTDNWVDNAAALAGYLGWSGNLEGFRQFLLGTGAPPSQSQLTHFILENYITIRASGYGKSASTAPGAKQGVGAKNISNKQIWLALNETEAKYQKLFAPAVNLPLPEDSGFSEGQNTYAVAVNIAAMSFLIHHNPQVFVASHLPRQERLHCVGVTDIPAEDWYRAALLLRFYHRHTSETKKTTGFLSKDQSKLNPRIMEYFSSEDVQGLDKMETEEADGDLDKRTPGEQMAEVNDEIATTEEPELQKFKDVIGYAEFVEGRAADWEQAVDTVDKDIRRNAPTLGSAGRTAKRVRMTENQLRQACAHLGRLVKVKHDDPSMQDALESQQKALEDNQLVEQAQVGWQPAGCHSRLPSFPASSLPLRPTYLTFRPLSRGC